MESIARSFIFGCAIAVILVVGVTWYKSAHAVVVCETDKQGRTCCWDTERDGSFRPTSCM
jgi:hypothetical protein